MERKFRRGGLSLQARLFLCPLKQGISKICEVWMKRHTSRVSGRCDNGQWNRHLPVAKSRLCYKYKKVDSATYKEPGVLRNGNRLCGDDSIVAKWKDRIDFQVLSKASANGGSDCKGIVKLSGYSEFDSTAISSSSFIHKVSLQKAVRRPLCNKKFRQQTVFGPYIKGETKLVARKFTLEQWEINSNSEISNSAM